jgi:hypothetical protein
MTNSGQMARSNLTAGDAAVDGLFSGALAGIPMVVYAVVVWLLIDPGAGENLGAFLAERDLSLLNTLLLHLAISSVYGLVFSLGYNLLRSRFLDGSLLGIDPGSRMALFGVLLLALAHLVILPAGAGSLQLSFGLSVPPT